jgi:hypothetical protein
MISLTSRHSVKIDLHDKRDSKQHYDNFEFFPLHGAGLGQLFPFLVTCQNIDGEPRA